MPNPKSLWANAIYENNMNENLSRQEDAIQKDMRFTDEMKQSLLKVLSKMKILSVIVCIVSILITLIAIIICFDGITKGAFGEFDFNHKPCCSVVLYLL